MRWPPRRFFSLSNNKNANTHGIKVVMPERFRPVQGRMYMREAIIDFGSSGYIARFRHLANGDIVIARIKHQKEDDFT